MRKKNGFGTQGHEIEKPEKLSNKRAPMLAGLLIGAVITAPTSPADASSALWDKYGYTVTIHGTLSRFNPFDVNGRDGTNGSEVDVTGKPYTDTVPKLARKIAEKKRRLKQLLALSNELTRKDEMAAMRFGIMSDPGKRLGLDWDTGDGLYGKIENLEKEINELETKKYNAEKNALKSTNPGKYLRFVARERNEVVKKLAEAEKRAADTRERIKFQNDEIRKTNKEIAGYQEDMKAIKKESKELKLKSQELKKKSEYYDRLSKTVTASVTGRIGYYERKAEKYQRASEDYETRSDDKLYSRYGRYGARHISELYEKKMELGGAMEWKYFHRRAVSGLEFDLKDEAAAVEQLRKKLRGIDADASEIKTQPGQYQITSGSPPDADFLYRLGRMRWWSNSDIRQIDESGGARLIKGTLTGLMVGGDMKLGANRGIGFGIGYGHSGLTQTDPFGGANITSNGINLMTNGYWGPNSNLLYDISFSYGYARFTNVRTAFSDTYGTHAFGFGFGVNMAHDFSPLWRGETRLGWSGSHSIRMASTDTSGFFNNGLTSNFGKATLSGRLLRKFADGSGHFFVDAALNAVTNDDSPAHYNQRPFDAEIGAGLRLNLGGAATLTMRGFVASLGRANRDEYGVSLKLGLDF